VITCDDITVRTIQSYCKMCVLVQVIVVSESDSTIKSENVTDTRHVCFCIFSFSVFSNPLLALCAALEGVLILSDIQLEYSLIIDSSFLGLLQILAE
jgi:hypothetical protein